VGQKSAKYMSHYDRIMRSLSMFALVEKFSFIFYFLGNSRCEHDGFSTYVLVGF
jgi:hypothetical protein